MTSTEKRVARKRRETKMRRWLVTLSWTLPVFSFGGFFTIWNDIAHAHPLASSNTKMNKEKSVTSPTKTTKNYTVAPSVLLKVGARNSEVTQVQEWLAKLGLFNHVFTQYYGQVTWDAVKQFQLTRKLTPTGEVDKTTLIELQKAVKNVQTKRILTRTSTNTQSGTVSAHSSSSSSARTPTVPSRDTSPQRATTSHRSSTSGTRAFTSAGGSSSGSQSSVAPSQQASPSSTSSAS